MRSRGRRRTTTTSGMTARRGTRIRGGGRAAAPALATAGALWLTAAPPAQAQQHEHHQAEAQQALLTQAGNGAFAAIQEVVARLEADPETDWIRVDLEALRRHLVDMDRMTREVEVVNARPVEAGVEFTVRPLGALAAESLRRVLPAHAGQLRAERGWSMDSQEEGGAFVVRVTSPRTDDAARIRGLGWIGVMALGDHHGPHHWMIATGQHPHAGSHPGS